MPQIKYLKGKKISAHKGDLFDKFEDKRSIHKLSAQPAFVQFLKDRFSEKELYYLQTYEINPKNDVFKVRYDLCTQNLPKNYTQPQYKFVFDEKDLKAMITSPKMIIAQGDYKYFKKDEQDKTFSHRIYLVAPELKETGLPYIFIITMLDTLNAESSVSLQALVGGCSDGIVNLLRIDSPQTYETIIGKKHIKFWHIHKAQPNKPNKNFEELPYESVDKNIFNFPQAIDSMFRIAQVKYKSYFNEVNINRIIDLYYKARKENVVEINSKEFINDMLGNKCDWLEKKERNADGKIPVVNTLQF